MCSVSVTGKAHTFLEHTQHVDGKESHSASVIFPGVVMCYPSKEQELPTQQAKTMSSEELSAVAHSTHVLSWGAVRSQALVHSVACTVLLEVCAFTHVSHVASSFLSQTPVHQATFTF